jgi:hypothetical protein
LMMMSRLVLSRLCWRGSEFDNSVTSLDAVMPGIFVDWLVCGSSNPSIVVL